MDFLATQHSVSLKDFLPFPISSPSPPLCPHSVGSPECAVPRHVALIITAALAQANAPPEKSCNDFNGRSSKHKDLASCRFHQIDRGPWVSSTYTVLIGDLSRSGMDRKDRRTDRRVDWWIEGRRMRMNDCFETYLNKFMFRYLMSSDWGQGSVKLYGTIIILKKISIRKYTNVKLSYTYLLEIMHHYHFWTLLHCKMNI